MQPNTSIEAIYSQKVSWEHRKEFAQFFTPSSIAEIMCKWLLGNNNLHTVLEPAFGLGVFSRFLTSCQDNIQIKGFEIDSVIFKEAQKAFSDNSNIHLVLEDYMYNDWQNKYDGIICNPPYFKFHDYDNKQILREIETKLKCRLNGFTNLYTLFLLKSIHQLKPSGRCAYIIPSEFLNSDYGKLVKSYLIKTGTLRHIIVFNFEEKVFDDALTTACLVFCANDRFKEKVQFTNIDDISDLSIVNKLIEDYPQMPETFLSYPYPILRPEIKWKAYYQTQNRCKYTNLVSFSEYAKVMRGIATGANDYFSFNSSKIKEYGIDERYFLPCICHSIDVRGNVFKHSDFEHLKEKDKKVFLLNAINVKDKKVLDYIEKGIRENINKKYLTSSRNPWYSIEQRPPSPIWVSVFNRSGLRFIRNEANILNLTTFHCIYPKTNIFSIISVDLLFAYLLTPTARRIFEDNSREYGNGLQKFEPNDLNNGSMLDLKLLPDKEKQKIESLYLSNKDIISTKVIKEIDDILAYYFAS